MGYDLIAAVFFVALTPLVILGFIAFWFMTHRERAELEDTWEHYAAARTREYFPARGEWPNRLSPGVRWTHGNVTYQLTAVGIEAGARTRISAKPHGRLLGSFALRFDGERLAITEQPAGLAERVLASKARRALLSFRQYDDVTLTYRRGRLTLEWPGRESNFPRLDEASAVLQTFVEAVDESFSAASSRLAS